MDTKLFDILVCPICKGKLHYHKDSREIICRADRLAFPIKDDIPLMLESEARLLTQEDLDAL